MNIIPNLGIGPLRFGMSPAEVRSLMLEDEKYEDWMGGNRSDSLLYRGLILEFDKHDSLGPLADSRFIGVHVRGREDAVLWGKNIHNWNRFAIEEYLDRANISYSLLKNRDLSVVSLSLTLSFDTALQLEFVELWSFPTQ
jgi:hypothetical protein